MGLSLFGIGCTGLPSGVQPVSDFDVQRYLGKWYEIARLDHSFERGLTDVSATYTARSDGGINVVNRGYDPKASRWKQVEGRAYFLGDKTVASLKVTFFWPFYGGYHVIALDQERYAHALVCGYTRSYLWILARQKTIEKPVLDKLIEQAKARGFDTDALIFVTHARPDG